MAANRPATSADYKPAHHWAILRGQAGLTLTISLFLTGVQALSLRSLDSHLDYYPLKQVDSVLHILGMMAGISSIVCIAAPSIVWANVLQHRATTFRDRVWPPLELEQLQTWGTIAMVLCVVLFALSNYIFALSRHANHGLFPILLILASAPVCYAFGKSIQVAYTYFSYKEAQWPELAPQGVKKRE